MRCVEIVSPGFQEKKRHRENEASEKRQVSSKESATLAAGLILRNGERGLGDLKHFATLAVSDFRRRSRPKRQIPRPTAKTNNPRVIMVWTGRMEGETRTQVNPEIWRPTAPV